MTIHRRNLLRFGLGILLAPIAAKAAPDVPGGTDYSEGQSPGAVNESARRLLAEIALRDTVGETVH